MPYGAFVSPSTRTESARLRTSRGIGQPLRGDGVSVDDYLSGSDDGDDDALPRHGLAPACGKIDRELPFVPDERGRQDEEEDKGEENVDQGGEIDVRRNAPPRRAHGPSIPPPVRPGKRRKPPRSGVRHVLPDDVVGSAIQHLFLIVYPGREKRVEQNGGMAAASPATVVNSAFQSPPEMDAIGESDIGTAASGKFPRAPIRCRAVREAA